MGPATTRGAGDDTIPWRIWRRSALRWRRHDIIIYGGDGHDSISGDVTALFGGAATTLFKGAGNTLTDGGSIIVGGPGNEYP
jgi:Ca2+-binding RTX toxin-like protein